ncbi:hypothetical protein RB614_03445 [Phytohabitans sp. ZYX-F-186]|uniref:Aromatic ring-opening dioxygenase LigA n=1 Tax=Phytohabitans maris TaxID=3071409 RepID=A0ABU0Z944_9ACTN|nr:hypothetical protein [Phytohabitans sp. ZYX-F-186]MDQ7903568.1 hypothetical protein [Phytohabitans sp. ZYX-F-186]
MTSLLLGVVGAALLVAGPIMIARGVTGRRTIRAELADQKIVFPDEGGELPAGLARYAGVRVTTGTQAQAFADLIGQHVAQATAGRTYSQVVDEWQATGRSDERLARLRQTAFMGQTLRGSLLGAYQAWQITTLVIGLGALLAATGLGFLTLAAT